MLESLKEQVCKANLQLPQYGVVIFTWGNVSAIDRERNLVVIKPSGVDYDVMTPEDMVVVDANTGAIVEGKWRPSSDTPTHLHLYRAFPNIGAVAHTHSTYAVAFAQAGLPIPALGTTHADAFHGNIPCTRSLTEVEVRGDYETNTGVVIEEMFRGKRLDEDAIPGVLVRNHGPFAWGKNCEDVVKNIVTLEKVAEMAHHTLKLKPDANLPQYILDKHYFRKHGKNAYYGQNTGKQKEK